MNLHNQLAAIFDYLFSCVRVDRGGSIPKFKGDNLQRGRQNYSEK